MEVPVGFSIGGFRVLTNVGFNFVTNRLYGKKNPAYSIRLILKLYLMLGQEHEKMPDSSLNQFSELSA